jgi:tungstate transport system substrate-binding protein
VRRSSTRCAAAAAVIIAAACGGGDTERSAGDLIVATTTSLHDSGLLDSLMPRFERQSGVAVKVIAVGTGAALDMAARGNADAVLVHAPAAERIAVERGDLIGGRLIMENDFFLLGPPADPAGARTAGDILTALRRIAKTGPFIGRGDGSGTDIKERELWRAAEIDVDAVKGRLETGQGMGATLLVAEERGGYTLSDRGTYLAFRRRLTLAPIAEGNPRLRNPYHAYLVNPARHPGTRRAAAEALITFLAAPETQRIIGDFGVAQHGRPLFDPAAAAGATAP